MASIKDNWNDARGDMMYGIGPEINKYLEQVYGLKHKSGMGGRVQDQAHKLKETQYAAINTYNVALSKDKFTSNNGVIAVTPPSSGVKQTESYLEALNTHKKYAPTTASGNVGTNPKLLTALQKGNSTIKSDSEKAALNAAAKELAIRRSCKFGIEYNVKNGAYIHYILDGMDMKKVAAKEQFDKEIALKFGPSLKFKKVSICTTELRYLFRNWQKIKSTGRVLFYWNYNTVKAPWEDAYWASSLDAWATYAAHRLEKMTEHTKANSKDLGGIYLQQFLKNKIDPFFAARNTNKPALKQIELFHQIPSELINT